MSGFQDCLRKTLRNKKKVRNSFTLIRRFSEHCLLVFLAHTKEVSTFTITFHIAAKEENKNYVHSF